MVVKIIKIWLVVLACIVVFALYAKKYANPYKLYMVFGKKGSGKSTLIAKLATKYVKQGRNVYVNIPLTLQLRPRKKPYGEVRSYDIDDIGRRTFPPESIVFCDEVGMQWDNRQFKSFRTDVRDWFKLQRHYRVTVWLFSQTFDIDLKLRNLTDQMYMVTNHFNVLSVARRVNRKLVIVEPTGDSEGRITDGYEIQPLIFQLIGIRSCYVTWIPRWSKSFDTRDLTGHVLPDIGFRSLPFSERRTRSRSIPRGLEPGANGRRMPFRRFWMVLTYLSQNVDLQHLFRRDRSQDVTPSVDALDLNDPETYFVPWSEEELEDMDDEA